LLRARETKANQLDLFSTDLESYPSNQDFLNRHSEMDSLLYSDLDPVGRKLALSDETSNHLDLYLNPFTPWCHPSIIPSYIVSNYIEYDAIKDTKTGKWKIRLFRDILLLNDYLYSFMSTRDKCFQCWKDMLILEEESSKISTISQSRTKEREFQESLALYNK